MAQSCACRLSLMLFPRAFPEKPLIIQKKPPTGKPLPANRFFGGTKKNPNLMGPG
jgi:hypothetical protein